MQKINIYSENDMRRIVKLEIGKRFFAYDKILNHLKLRLIDVEKIMEVEPKSLPSIRPHKLKDSLRDEKERRR